MRWRKKGNMRTAQIDFICKITPNKIIIIMYQAMIVFLAFIIIIIISILEKFTIDVLNKRHVYNCMCECLCVVF